MASPTHIIFRRLAAALDADDPSLVMLPESKKVAIDRGSTHFFTGKPCKRGHVAPRKTTGHQCVCCERDFWVEYRKRPEVRKRLHQHWQRPEVRQAAKDYNRRPEIRKRTRQREREYNQEYGQRPGVRIRHREYQQRREAGKIKATPRWLTQDQLEQMRATYAEAQRLTDVTGIPHHVDHIIPLTHPDVQGLHVPWNLQVLPYDENIRKNNSFDGTMDNEGWRRSRS